MRKIALAVVLAGIMLAGFAATSSAKTVWLCKPGQQPDPCTPGLSTTVYTPAGKQVKVEHPRQVSHPAIDCFYVYPTVSNQKTGNANLNIDPEERSIALYQAARYSQYCRVYAPMYRQLTIVGISNGQFGKPTTTPNPALAFQDVQTAFQTYLRKYNHGRGFVLIGHSQGSFVLRALIARDVDTKPAIRKRLVSAILFGGNVVVKRGSGIGGDFKHISACTSATQPGCVIAFSTFNQVPPSDTIFGKPVSPVLQPVNNPNLQVLCTNPAALAGGSGVLDPIQPSAPFAPGLIATGIAALKFTVPHPPTVFWTAPGSYSARCETLNGATVLEITPLNGAPTITPSPTPMWGLHLVDANIALGNLIGVVKSEAAAFVRSGR